MTGTQKWLYTSLRFSCIKPNIEAIWDPHLKKNTNFLEDVQKWT